MNKLIGIAAILTIAIFAAGALATAVVADNTGYEKVICNDASTCGQGQTCVNNACTAIVCGITAVSSDPGWIAFPDLVPGTDWTHSADTTLVTNTGNQMESPTISGDYWYGNTYGTNNNAYMPVESTAWTTTDWNGAVVLHSATAPIVTTPLSPLGTTTVYYELKVPANTPTDAYTQAITFSTGC